MSMTKTSNRTLTPTERHEFVAFGVTSGKSNRTIAKELGVDEGTIRRDRKFLATPENERPVRVPRPKKTKKERLVRELSPDERCRLRQQHMLNVVQLWIKQEGLLIPDLELFVLPKAGKLLHQHRHSISELPEPVKSPKELLSLTRPTYVVEEYMPSKFEFYEAEQFGAAALAPGRTRGGQSSFRDVGSGLHAHIVRRHC
jgi:transposase-like protein